MKTQSLRKSIILSFFAVIALIGILVFLFGNYIISTQVIRRAQDRVNKDLHTAHAVFRGEIDQIHTSFSLIGDLKNVAELKEKLKLDYLYVVSGNQKNSVPSEIVAEAFKGNTVCWKRIIGEPELRRMNDTLYERAVIDIKPTPKARPCARTKLTSAMAIECAKPFFDSSGAVVRVMYGGRIVNRYFELVDRIRDFVYENKLYKSKPIGTVTIFQNDVRIATNVLNDNGQRAIGTRVSDIVYKNVVENGLVWQSRAFVVTDWYLTAYEPIKDIRGAIIGILYVGVLEKPFKDTQRALLLALLAIIGISVLIASAVSLALAQAVSRPVTDLLKATKRISEGDFSRQPARSEKVREFSVLLGAFDTMAHALNERDESLRESSQRLKTLNKTYLDLVAMVSHELKGVLAPTMLNAYSLRDKILGDINEKQKKALTSITRNLDYLDTTVKNFLNLSRIEKSELSLHIGVYHLKEDVFDTANDAFSTQAGDNAMKLESDIPSNLAISGDVSLMQIVMNNLVSNAIKYGSHGGKIMVRAAADPQTVTVEVYNDGRPLQSDEINMLFKRFTRLNLPEGGRVRGTGIGLFITKQIIEKHGGGISVEPRQQGNSFIFSVPRNPEQKMRTGALVNDLIG